MADRELSRKPNSIRRRLSKGKADPERDKAMLYEIGYKPVSSGTWRNWRGAVRGTEMVRLLEAPPRLADG